MWYTHRIIIVVVTFLLSDNQLGCADKVPYGVEPNEHGTWLYGRDGWCDGQDVKPWIIDVTSQVSYPSEHDITAAVLQMYKLDMPNRVI